MVTRTRGTVVLLRQFTRQVHGRAFLLAVLVLLAAGGSALFAAATGDKESALLSGADEASARTWLEQFNATGDEAGAGYWFGHAVAIDGNTALVGAWSDDANSAPNAASGAAYIFRRATPESHEWYLVAELSASDGHAGDGFGQRVALDGDTALVAASGQNGGPGNAFPQAGAVYVYQRDHDDPDAWREVAKLTAADAAEGDYFGRSLALDGDTALIGAWLKDSDLADAGAAYVFERNWGGDDAWGQVAKLTGEQRYGHFGSGVALDAGALLIAANFEDNGYGAAYLYERDAGDPAAWHEIARLTPGNSTFNSWYGWDVALDADTALIGAPRDSAEANLAGSAYVYQRNWGGDNHWGQVTRLTAGNVRAEEWFGISVALEQGVAVVGAYREDGEGDPFTDSGAAYVFERDLGGSDAWGQTVKLTASDAAPGALFGRSVALDDGNILVGAEGANVERGAAYWFEPAPISNISLTKSSAVAAPLLPGEPVTYTLTFGNQGPGAGSNVVITDTVPGALTNVAYLSSGVPLTTTSELPSLRWRAGDLLPGATGTITLTGAVSPTLSTDTVLTNTAGVTTEGVNLSDHSSDAVALAVAVPRAGFEAVAFTASEGEVQGAATITLTLGPPNPFADASVAYETHDGSAVAGSDYVASAGRLTIPAGQTGGAFTVPILDNDVAGRDRTLSLILSEPRGAALGAITEATLTILEDDRAGITVRPTSLALTEGLPGDAYTVQLDSEPTAAVTVTIAADTQIKAIPGELIFDSTNWRVAQSVTVTAVDDDVVEGVHGSQITHLATSHDPEYDDLPIAGVTVTIHDNDSNHRTYLPLLRSRR
ncbi:MAG TPA: Calx-beta domain-containing protein [Candidatus Sulfomarinibacteraceae bacterium]|nr:Calx-beta domain-containing protein [Candidatus Sulfomarinibacteraceae bacterium]